MTGTKTFITFNFYQKNQIEKTQEIELTDSGYIRIGKVPSCQVNLEGIDGVSRMHAEILKRNGKVEIIDLGSQKGTFINGQKQARAWLKSGDEIRIGEARIVVDIAEKKEASRTAKTTENIIFDYSNNNANLSDAQIEYLKNARAEVVARIVAKFGDHVAAKVEQCLTHEYDFKVATNLRPIEGKNILYPQWYAYVYGPNNPNTPYYTTKRSCSCPAGQQLEAGQYCKHSLALFAILETRRIAEEAFAADILIERPAF